MNEADARQLCTLYVPHVNSNANILRGAKDAGVRFAKWADVWYFYATTPCPWEVLYPGWLVGFEPPGIAEHYPGRKTVRRPVEDTRLPASLTVPANLDDEGGRPPRRSAGSWPISRAAPRRQ